jgi:hypothetical protein
VLGVALWGPVRRACLKELEHEVIVYCKANPQIRIIEAIDVLKWTPILGPEAKLEKGRSV